MRSESPTGLVLGPGIGWSPVRFPAPRRSFRGHFGVTFSSILGWLGMCLGVVWGRFRMVLGWFWKTCRTGSKNENFQKWPGVFFPGSGHYKYTFLGYPRYFFEKCFFAVFLYINSRSTALSGLYVNPWAFRELWCMQIDLSR